MAHFTAAPAVGTEADWSTAVLKPSETPSEEFTEKARVEFYSDHAQSYDGDMEKYEFRY